MDQRCNARRRVNQAIGAERRRIRNGTAAGAIFLLCGSLTGCGGGGGTSEAAGTGNDVPGGQPQPGTTPSSCLYAHADGEYANFLDTVVVTGAASKTESSARRETWNASAYAGVQVLAHDVYEKDLLASRTWEQIEGRTWKSFSTQYYQTSSVSGPVGSLAATEEFDPSPFVYTFPESGTATFTANGRYFGPAVQRAYAALGLSGDTMKFVRTFTLTYLGKEAVEVPAGKFSEACAFKVDSTQKWFATGAAGDQPLPSPQSASPDESTKIWAAPGVGIVKAVMDYSLKNGSDEFKVTLTRSLQSGLLGGKKY